MIRTPAFSLYENNVSYLFGTVHRFFSVYTFSSSPNKSIVDTTPLSSVTKKHSLSIHMYEDDTQRYISFKPGIGTKEEYPRPKSGVASVYWTYTGSLHWGTLMTHWHTLTRYTDPLVTVYIATLGLPWLHYSGLFKNSMKVFTENFRLSNSIHDNN